MIPTPTHLFWHTWRSIIHRPQGVEILSIIIKSCCIQDSIKKRPTEQEAVTRLQPFQDLKCVETIDEETAKLNCDIMLDIPKAIDIKMGDKTKKEIDSTYRRMCQQETIMKRLMEQEVISLLQSFEEIKLQEEVIGKEKINEAVIKLNDDIAASRKSEASIREEASGKIQKLRAENNLEVQRIINRKARTICHLFGSYLSQLNFSSQRINECYLFWFVQTGGDDRID